MGVQVVWRVVLLWTLVGGCVGAPPEVEIGAQAIAGGTVVTSATQFAAVGRYDRDVDDELLSRNWEARCSATMISKVAVLLAGHCVCASDQECSQDFVYNERRVYFDDPTIEGFDGDCTGSPQLCPWFLGTAIHVHPDFVWDGVLTHAPHNDYAVMRIDRELSSGKILELDGFTWIEPIAVDPSRMSVGQVGTLVGYGQYGLTNDSCLTHDGIDSVKRSTTIELEGYVTYSPGVNLEFEHPTRGACPGDSGGPVIDPSGKVAGVASTASGDHSRYAAADVAYPWLQEVACPHFDEADPDAEQCSAFCRCSTGESDCDSDNECMPGAMCALDVGKVNGNLDEDWDLCWSTSHLVRVYRDNNYSGAMQGLPPASWGGAELGTVGDNAISSLRVPAGLTARLCAGATGGSPCEEITSDTPSLDGALADDISYVRVYPGVRLYRSSLPATLPHAQTFKAGIYTASQMTAVGDNMASALVATPGVSVRLCDGAGGQAPCRDLWGYHATLPLDIDDRASWVEVRLGATLYEGEDFTGDSQAFPIGTWTHADFTHISNNSVTSLVVAPGRTATLCSLASGTGTCKTFSEGWHSFVGFNMDQSTSWVRVE